MAIDTTVIPRTTDVNAIVDNITLDVAAGKIQIKDLGVASGKIADSAVITTKIRDGNVTFAKLDGQTKAFVLLGIIGV